MPRITNKDTEIQILADALRALRAQTGITHEPPVTDRKYAGVGRQIDGYIWLQAPLDRYVFEIKTNLTPAQIGAVAARLKTLPLADQPLLVADHITPRVAEALRDLDIQFIDTAGNAFLRHEDPLVHVWVTGRKPEERTAQKPVAAFRAKGLRVIFPLLCLPGAVDATYREIAGWAGVALGTVANTLADLKRLGYLHKTRRGHILEQREALQQRWVEAYAQELRPRLKPQRFQVLTTDWWRTFGRPRFEQYGLWLGGEGAAALLTNYLHPERITVYGEPDFPKLAHELKPARTGDGNLELLRPFWHFEIPDFDPACATHRFCPPLLIYADLLMHGDARHLDAANIIKKRYLHAGSEY